MLGHSRYFVSQAPAPMVLALLDTGTCSLVKRVTNCASECQPSLRHSRSIPGRPVWEARVEGMALWAPQRRRKRFVKGRVTELELRAHQLGGIEAGAGEQRVRDLAENDSQGECGDRE